MFIKGRKEPDLQIKDKFENCVGTLFADIRFFPKRKGTFTDMPVDGRTAKTWVKEHCGVAVFDRNFRVLPYGTEGDDWLELSADVAKRLRKPRSSLAQGHLAMSKAQEAVVELHSIANQFL